MRFVNSHWSLVIECHVLNKVDFVKLL